ncbi:hypothetical protein PSN45_001461 [Yamadazyma tenuis]|uniref:uncharacterized protein n=1 Tax=Candida tenuis TaxID=2315449 RepID=UPI0027A71273|nr:hypothetical protein PSN45_001461 [Yamadazyma tenuis]
MRGLQTTHRLVPRLTTVITLAPRCSRYVSTTQQEAFLKEYKIRSSLERLIFHYAQRPLSKFSIQGLIEQSESLSPNFILQNAQNTVEYLLAYNARRLREFRRLPYLVVLNPSVAESYNGYLNTMSSLITASLYPPATLEENHAFAEKVLDEFINIHSDTLPSLSRGFNEVLHLVSTDRIKQFLDEHLRERISMRLIAHQHIQLSKALKEGTYVKGGKYNGVIKELDIYSVIKKNAEVVNDICLMKYDQAVEIRVDNNLYSNTYWSRAEPDLKASKKSDKVLFPYIEYHLDYMLTELFKNSFRAHIENKVHEPVNVTVSVSHSPLYLEVRIRDRGKGIPPAVLKHMFDYSFSTYESQEGEAYKTLNQPPGLGGNTVAGMGYGLPLSKNYIEIFNDTIPKDLDVENDAGRVKGSLTIQSYHGWGTDVYLKTVGS